MKRNIAKVLAVLLMTATVLAGCSKNEPTNEPTSDMVESTAVTIIGSGEHQVGETVIIDNIISIEEASAGNVIQKAILAGNGSLLTELDTSTPGSYEVTVIVEFADSSGFSGVYSYEVIGSTGDEQAVQLLNAADAYEVFSLPNGSLVTVLHDKNLKFFEAILTNGEVTYQEGDISYTESNKDNANYIQFTSKGKEYYLTIKDAASSTFITADMLLESLSIPANESESDYESEEQTEEDKYAGYFTTILQNLIKDKGIESVGNLWSIDGRQYTVERSLIGINYSYLTGQVSDDVVLTSSYRLTDVDTADTITLNVIDSDLGYAIFEPFMSDVVSDVELPEDYDGYLSYVRDNVDTSVFVKEDTFTVESVKNVLLAGQSVTVAEPESTEEVDIEEQLQEIPNDTIAKETTYNQRHPEIYTWPDSETKYRRFLYVITSNTTFNQAIYFPDGTYRLSGDDEYKDNITIGDDGSGGNSGNTNSSTHNIISPYATYVLSNGGDSELVFDYNTSNASRLVFTYGGQKYYVESVKSSDITRYQKNSIYNPDFFKDGSFTVTSSNEDKRVTSLGQIIPYNVSYTDPNSGRNVKSGYMCVYNIQNDYLCIYSENLASTVTLLGLMEKVVVEVK